MSSETCTWCETLVVGGGGFHPICETAADVANRAVTIAGNAGLSASMAPSIARILWDGRVRQPTDDR